MAPGKAAATSGIPSPGDISGGLSAAEMALKALIHEVLSKIPGTAESEAQIDRALDDALANTDLPALFTAIKADVVALFQAGHGPHSPDAADLA